MVWKMGPECVAQQAKKVSPRTMNCGERSAAATEEKGSGAAGAPALPGAPGAAAAGACRTSRPAGRTRAAAMRAMVNCALRQSIVATSQLANGDMVIGATPTPIETSETASARRRSNQFVTVAISGAKKLPDATPTSTP